MREMVKQLSLPKWFLPACLALLVAAAALPAVAAASATKLEVNENCVELNWPCWTTEGTASRPKPALKVTIPDGGSLAFADRGREANIAWEAPAPTCEPSVPVAPTAPRTGWEGTCTFTAPGTYRFESSTMFDDGYNNYRKYEIVVGATPKAETTLAGARNQTEATFEGSVSPEGNATEYRFEYGTTSVSEHATSTLALGAEDFAGHAVSTTVGGLSPGSAYHVRLTVLYGEAHAAVHGEEREFVTPAAAKPVVKTAPTSGLGETEATLNGTVDPDGEATKYRFEYGPSEAAYVATAPVTLPADGATHTVAAPVKGLAAGSEYSFRLIAENGKGASEATGTFKTASPPAKQPSLEPKPSPGSQPTPGPTSPEPMVPLLAPVAAEGVGTPAPAAIPGSLRLAVHGAGVRGSIGVGAAGVGARLRVELLAKPAALGLRGSKPVVVGRLERASIRGGTLRFALSLTARARSALHRRGRLVVTAKVVLAPTDGRTAQLTRTLTLRV